MGMGERGAGRSPADRKARKGGQNWLARTIKKSQDGLVQKYKDLQLAGDIEGAKALRKGRTNTMMGKGLLERMPEINSDSTTTVGGGNTNANTAGGGGTSANTSGTFDTPIDNPNRGEGIKSSKLRSDLKIHSGGPRKRIRSGLTSVGPSGYGLNRI